MWKKEDELTERPEPRARPTPTADRGTSSPRTPATATIGRSIAIRGDVTGDEDLLIQGRVDGSVDLEEHAVTVGPDGVVKASVVARVVTVEGRVEGDLRAEEQVILRGSAWVQGDISAPRVVLEDGARFRGGVDMGEMESPKSGGKSASSGSSKPTADRSSVSADARGANKTTDNVPAKGEESRKAAVATGG